MVECYIYSRARIALRSSLRKTLGGVSGRSSALVTALTKRGEVANQATSREDRSTKPATGSFTSMVERCWSIVTLSSKGLGEGCALTKKCITKIWIGKTTSRTTWRCLLKAMGCTLLVISIGFVRTHTRNAVGADSSFRGLTSIRDLHFRHQSQIRTWPIASRATSSSLIDSRRDVVGAKERGA